MSRDKIVQLIIYSNYGNTDILMH